MLISSAEPGRHDAFIVQHVLSYWTGMAGLTFPFQLLINGIPVEIDESDRLKRILLGLAEQLVQRGFWDRASTKAGDGGVALDAAAGDGHAHVGGDDAAHADSKAFL